MSGEIILIHVSKPKVNTVDICYDGGYFLKHILYIYLSKQFYHKVAQWLQQYAQWLVIIVLHQYKLSAHFKEVLLPNVSWNFHKIFNWWQCSTVPCENKQCNTWKNAPYDLTPYDNTQPSNFSVNCLTWWTVSLDAQCAHLTAVMCSFSTASQQFCQDALSW